MIGEKYDHHHQHDFKGFRIYTVFTWAYQMSLTVQICFNKRSTHHVNSCHLNLYETLHKKAWQNSFRTGNKKVLVFILFGYNKTKNKPIDPLIEMFFFLILWVRVFARMQIYFPLYIEKYKI